MIRFFKIKKRIREKSKRRIQIATMGKKFMEFERKIRFDEKLSSKLASVQLYSVKEECIQV